MQDTGVSLDRCRDLEELVEAARLHERLRIAQDLHDRLAQTLAALVIEAEGLRRRLRAGGAAGDAELAEIVASAREALSDLRSFVRELRSQGPVTCSLVDRLKEALFETGARAGLATEFKVFGPRPRLPSEQEEVLLRVVREALNNVERHSRARRVAVSVARRPDALEILVEDDGIGLSAEARQRAMASGRFGLVSMRERVLALGGALEIGSRPGQGTKLRIRIPLHGHHGGGT